MTTHEGRAISMMYGWRFGEGGGLWWLLGLICMGVLIGAVVGLVINAVRGNRNPMPPQQGPWQPPYQAPGIAPQGPGYPAAPLRPTPHDILRERLARGEISIEEFERTKAALGPDPSGPPPAK